MRPLIGLSGPSSFTDECIDTIEDYLNANFVLLYHKNEDNLREWLEKCDGIIIGGGVDVHPSVYGQHIHNHSNLSKFNIDRDIRELTAIDHCIKKQKPLMGICRGHQMIGIYHKMEIIADISNGDTAHAPHKCGITVSRNEPVHTVKLIGPKTQEYFKPIEIEERKSIKNFGLFTQLDENEIWVNSYHHQAIRYEKDEKNRQYKKEDVIVVGTADTGLKSCEEIVELMRGRNAPWISCQWHPEIDYEVNTPSRKVLDWFKELLARTKK